MEILRALAVLAEKPVSETEEVALSLGLSKAPSSSTFTDLFSFQLYPFASVYLGETGHIGGDAQEAVAGFWRVLGGDAPKEPDHLAALLALYAGLKDALKSETLPERKDALTRARSTLLSEHLLSWLPPFLLKCEEIAAPPYDEWASVLEDVLRSEAGAANVAQCAPTILGRVGECPDPRQTGFEEFAAGLMAPARSGFILTGMDLRRCAGETATGTRVGERTFLLKSLLGQDAPNVLRWLGTEAHRSGELYERWKADIPVIVDHWQHRAKITAKLCDDLAADVDFTATE